VEHGTASGELTYLGRSAYLGARLDYSISAPSSVIVEAALVHINATATTGSETHPFFGAGFGHDLTDAWHLEAIVEVGPRTAGVSTLAASMQASVEMGGDEERDVPARLESSIAFEIDRFRWSGSGGPTVYQDYVTASLLGRPSGRLELTARGMYFAYQGGFAPDDARQAASLGALARVGTYAPRALVAGKAGYWLTSRLLGWLELDGIQYAGHIGSGTLALGGLSYQLAKRSHMLLGVGALSNRLEYPVLGDEPSIMPAAEAEIEISF
jgi:hypothetical protein